MDKLLERLREHGWTEVAIWEPITAGQPATTEVQDEATGEYVRVKRLPTLHLMADCVAVASASKRDGHVPSRRVSLGELVALADQLGRVLCGLCQRRLAILLERRVEMDAAARARASTTLRQVLHELTADHARMDEPVYVTAYDSDGSLARWVVTGLSVRATGQTLTLEPVEEET